MAASEELPQEIWDQVFRHLSQKELLLAASTCRKWYTRLRRHFYTYIRLKNLEMSEDFVSTLAKDPSLGDSVTTLTIQSSDRVKFDEENRFYDTLSVLIQQTQLVHSIKISYRIKRVFFEILRSACNAGFLSYVQTLRTTQTTNHYLFWCPDEPFSKESFVPIAVETISDKEVVVNNPGSRLEVAEIDSIINQHPEASTLKLNFYRLTDFHSAINLAEPCFNITQLIVNTPWPTNALLVYICEKFVSLQHLELVQPYNNSYMDNFVPGMTISRFASYLSNMTYFKVALLKLKSDTDVESHFKNILDNAHTRTWTSRSGQTLFMMRPTIGGTVMIGHYRTFAGLQDFNYSWNKRFR